MELTIRPINITARQALFLAAMVESGNKTPDNSAKRGRIGYEYDQLHSNTLSEYGSGTRFDDLIASGIVESITEDHTEQALAEANQNLEKHLATWKQAVKAFRPYLASNGWYRADSTSGEIGEKEYRAYRDSLQAVESARYAIKVLSKTRRLVYFWRVTDTGKALLKDGKIAVKLTK